MAILNSVLSIKDLDLQSVSDVSKANALMTALLTVSPNALVNSATWQDTEMQAQLRTWMQDRAGMRVGAGKVPTPTGKLHAHDNRVDFFEELFKQIARLANIKKPTAEQLPKSIDLEAAASINGVPVSPAKFIKNPTKYAHLIRNSIVDGKPVKLLPGSTDDLIKLEVVLANQLGKETVCTFDWDVKALRELFARYQYNPAQSSASAPNVHAAPELKILRERLEKLNDEVAGVKKDVTVVRKDVTSLGTDVREQQQSTVEFLTFTEGAVNHTQQVVEVERRKVAEHSKKLNTKLDADIKRLCENRKAERLFRELEENLEDMFISWKVASTDVFSRQKNTKEDKLSKVGDSIIGLIPAPFGTALGKIKEAFVDNKIDDMIRDRFRDIRKLLPKTKTPKEYARELSYIFTDCVVNYLNAHNSNKPGVLTVLESIPFEQMECVAVLIQAIITYHIYEVKALKIDLNLTDVEITKKLTDRIVEKFLDKNGGTEMLNEFLNKLINKYAPKTRGSNDSIANQHVAKKGLLDWAESLYTATVMKTHAVGNLKAKGQNL